jgi:hypothetical protein
VVQSANATEPYPCRPPSAHPSVATAVAATPPPTWPESTQRRSSAAAARSKTSGDERKRRLRAQGARTQQLGRPFPTWTTTRQTSRHSPRPTGLGRCNCQ